MYLTHEEYIAKGGTLDAAVFTNVCERASLLVDKCTFGRLKEAEPSDAVKKCIMDMLPVLCRRIEIIEGRENVISSESNDGVSVSYNVISPSDLTKELDAEVADIIRLHLCHEKMPDGTPLLYRGIG